MKSGDPNAKGTPITAAPSSASSQLLSKIDNKHAPTNQTTPDKATPHQTACLAAAASGEYSKLETLLMVHIDFLDGISSRVEIDAKKYPTGVAFVRDATKAIPLEKRLPPNNPTLLADNMLLRALNTLRGIDFVLEKKGLKPAREKLKSILTKLVSDTMTASILTAEKIEHLHASFNTELIKILRANHLDEGINAQGYKKLLLHYRDMTSVLEPAKSLVTVLRDQQPNEKDKTVEVIHTEISHPITKKTAIQRDDQLKCMGTENPPIPAGENYHSKQKKAFRIINTCFAELLKKDDRLLSGQNRKTIAPTVKNAYMVHNLLEFKITDTKTQKLETKLAEFKSLRCGSPVYIGGFATTKQQEEYTRENFKQLKAAAELMGANNIHITMLLTDSLHNRQHTIVSITKSVRSEKAFDFRWTYVPTNSEGTGRPLEISRAISKHPDCPSHGMDLLSNGTFCDKASRVTKAKRIILLISKDSMTSVSDDKVAAFKDKMINLTICASGQDRTGTAQEVATQQWIRDQYALLGIQSDHIPAWRVAGGHNVLLATFAAPGSLGLKKDSRPDKYFPDIVNTYLYRKTADTNKESPFDTEVVSHLPEHYVQDDKVIEEKKSEVSEQDICWVVKRMDMIADEYAKDHKTSDFSASTHAADVLALTNKVTTQAVSNLPALKRLQAITETLLNSWNNAITKKILKDKKEEANPGDKLITYLNINPDGHRFYRGVGILLQDIRERFPQLTKRISTSITPQWLESERAVYKRDIKETDYNDLKAVIEKLDAKQVAPLLDTIKSELDYKAKYNNLISELNKIWIRGAKENCESYYRLFYSLQQQSDSLAIKIQKTPEKYGLLSIVGILLQTAQEKYPGITFFPKINLPQQHIAAMTDKSQKKSPS